MRVYLHSETERPDGQGRKREGRNGDAAESCNARIGYGQIELKQMKECTDEEKEDKENSAKTEHEEAKEEEDR